MVKLIDEYKSGDFICLTIVIAWQQDGFVLVRFDRRWNASELLTAEGKRPEHGGHQQRRDDPIE